MPSVFPRLLAGIAVLATLLTAGARNSTQLGKRGKICTGSNSGGLVRNQQAVACIVIGSSSEKAVFYPHVDQYAMLEISDWDLNQDSGEIWVAVEGAGVVGQKASKEWADHNKRFLRNSQVVPFFTAVVHLNNGVVERVQWDSGCFTCSATNEEMCLADGSDIICSADEEPCRDCTVRVSDCVGKCTPKVYLAWLGTDAYGVPCTSAGKVISRFRSSSASGMVDTGGSTTLQLTKIE